jgi:hypothetical protein
LVFCEKPHARQEFTIFISPVMFFFGEEVYCTPTVSRHLESWSVGRVLC